MGQGVGSFTFPTNEACPYFQTWRDMFGALLAVGVIVYLFVAVIRVQ
jgi:hypothetical protein